MNGEFIVQALPVQITKQGKYFVAYSPVLDLSTSGKSFSEAQKRFVELVGVFFGELMEAGTMHDVLTELGWSRQTTDTPWQPPHVETESIDVRIPVGA